MPKRTDIETILVIGSGPIVIGQACEFDYSGSQACRVLRSEGYRVVLVNSNPATIMTDPSMADATYLEPLTVGALVPILERERPDAILPTLGGQTALNLAMEMHRKGILDELGIQLIGASPEAIETAESRERFREAMTEIGLKVPPSFTVGSVSEALSAASAIGYPVIVRPSYILGGMGTGIASSKEELKTIAERALRTSPVGEALIERYLKGYKEFELEVMRDCADCCVVVCSIENLDPMGVHTGDSITVAPAQTLADREYQAMREQAFACIRRVGVETGGSNIQFALHPDDPDIYVIEMNPRVSRSSALASKATGFPIAKIAARLAIGYRLDEIPNDITAKTPACFEPAIDYVVTKIPRFAFEKLPGSSGLLGSSMQSVGEAMAIGRTFASSLQKAIRALEVGREGLVGDHQYESLLKLPTEELLSSIEVATPDRIFKIAALLEKGVQPEEVASRSDIDVWFVDRMKEIVEEAAKWRGVALEEASSERLRRAKEMGFSDAQLAHLASQGQADRGSPNGSPNIVTQRRHKLGVTASFKRVDTCAGEFEAYTPYYYSSYEEEDELAEGTRPQVVVLGAGPNRIGQGIEFDYCCVHAAQTLKEEGYEAVMLNSNPETVSTDYDVSERLFFEPVAAEEVAEVVEALRRGGRLRGVIPTLGGQTPLRIAQGLPAGLILGTPLDSIKKAEDRDLWRQICSKLGFAQPESGVALELREARSVAAALGYPVLVRPSFVLGGRAMEVVYDEAQLTDVWRRLEQELSREGARRVADLGPVLIDKFLEDATEVDVDAVRDEIGTVVVGGIMEHVEEAGIHSGDSACVVPPDPDSEVGQLSREIEDVVAEIAEELNVIGLVNVQLAVKDKQLYVIEVNPRASRTVPFISKAVGISLAQLATRCIIGMRLHEMADLEARWRGRLKPRSVVNLASRMEFVAVKEAVLPFVRFPEVDALLGPEMRSTGEVMGLGRSFAEAFARSQEAAGSPLPTSGVVLFSLADRDKAAGARIARRLSEVGFEIYATEGTAIYFQGEGVKVSRVVPKRGEESSKTEGDAVELIEKGAVALVINTPFGRGARADGAYIRRAAVAHGIPCITTMSAATAACRAIEARLSGDKGADWPKSLQELAV
jgi:carbamoyl-phosphate synthase large subunit